VTYENEVYGDRKNFLARYHVYNGFENSSEFNEYLSILLDWESKPQKSH
jgi:hypothetical protein